MLFIGGDTAVEGKANVCSLFTITKEWKESEVTWYNASDDKEWEMLDLDTKYYNPNIDDSVSNPGGCDYDRKPVDIVDYVDINSWENYDVTEVIKQAVNNGKSFHGFMIKQFLHPAEEDKGNNAVAKGIDGRLYWASEYDEVDKRPKLTVKYTSTGISAQFSNKMEHSVQFIKRGNKIIVIVPGTKTYDLTLFNLKGKELISLKRCTTHRTDIPAKYLSSGLHVMIVTHARKNVSIKFPVIK